VSARRGAPCSVRFGNRTGRGVQHTTRPVLFGQPALIVRAFNDRWSAAQRTGAVEQL